MMKLYQPIRKITDTKLKVGTPEDCHLDYKLRYNIVNQGGRRISKNELRKERREVARDIAQFANTFGGSLVVGVKEGEPPNEKGPKISIALVGIDVSFDRLREEIERSIQLYLTPIVVVEFRSYTIEGKEIFVVNVNPSVTLIAVSNKHCPTDPSIEYIRRLNHGRGYMQPFEIEAKISVSRAMQLKMLGFCYNDKAIIRIPEGVIVCLDNRDFCGHEDPICWIENPGANHICLEILHTKGGVYFRGKVNIPYEMMRYVWLVDGGLCSVAVDSGRTIVAHAIGMALDYSIVLMVPEKRALLRPHGWAKDLLPSIGMDPVC